MGSRLDPQSYFIGIANIRNKFTHKLQECILDIYRYPTFFNISYKTDGIRIIKGENIDSYGNIDLKQQFDHIDSNTHDKFQRTQLFYNDLVFTVRGLIGKVGIYKSTEAANINANVIKIRLKNNVNADFLWYFFNTSIAKKLIENSSSGQVQKTITVKDILNIPIPLPIFEKQNEIAENIQAIRAKAMQLQKKAREVQEKVKMEVEREIEKAEN
ncbi:hypothetical protein EZS27_022471 [termite gut metagenome]|uniref:Type I restriction modification DNA specificity domain-containing protein n=1 Tax=termite gut metagenome TaxID=433724 RepID=A0A5J4R5S6_9ZZZZ